VSEIINKCRRVVEKQPIVVFIRCFLFLFLLVNEDVRASSSLPDVIEGLLLPVVAVSTSKSFGTGFIISEDGYMLTNNHVIVDSQKIEILMNDGKTRFSADFIGSDDVLDVAVLKIKTNGKLKFPFIKIKPSPRIKVGTSVIVIGNPYNIGISVTTGIISGLNRNLQITSFDDFIQTDASINKGNSGGPIFDTNGNIIGLISANYSNTNISFAIPIDNLISIIEELKTYGYVKRGWIGVDVEKAQDEIFAALNLKTKRGVIVTNVAENSPAMKAGILVSDIILLYDKKEIKSPSDLLNAVSSTSVGSDVNVSILRNAKVMKVSIKIDEMNKDNDINAFLSKSFEIFDMFLIPINKKVRNKFKIAENLEGMYILMTEKNGIADKNGIKEGDVLLSVNQNKAINGEIIKKSVNDALATKSNQVMLIVNNNRKNKTILIPIRQ
jgi:serine protease Do